MAMHTFVIVLCRFLFCLYSVEVSGKVIVTAVLGSSKVIVKACSTS